MGWVGVGGDKVGSGSVLVQAGLGAGFSDFDYYLTVLTELILEGDKKEGKRADDKQNNTGRRERRREESDAGQTVDRATLPVSREVAWQERTCLPKTQEDTTRPPRHTTSRPPGPISKHEVCWSGQGRAGQGRQKGQQGHRVWRGLLAEWLPQSTLTNHLLSCYLSGFEGRGLVVVSTG